MRRRHKKGDSHIAIGYIRVSTDRQELGPEAQIAAIESWCLSREIKLAEVYSDVGISGATPLDERPGFLAALSALETHQAGILIAAKRDRIARSVEIGAVVSRLVAERGASVVSADGVGNGDEPESALMRAIVDAMAEYERALIRLRTKAALAAKKRRGERVGSVPYGYSLEEGGIKLVPNPDEQRAISLARHWRDLGLTLREIAMSLGVAGFRPRGGASWHPQTVAHLLVAVR